MIHLGLIGYPLEHSLSPKIHSAALKACELDGDYSLFPILTDDFHGLKDLLSRVRTGEICGLNVTIPHKQNVISFLDELTPTAKAIGAVNTIYLLEDKLIGGNTDAPGFLSDLNLFIANHKSKIENPKSAIVFGAGGSARAVVYALIHDGWNVTIAARRIEQAWELASQFKNTKAVDLNFRPLELLNFQLIINTTPVGMHPNTDQSPLPKKISLSPNSLIYDLVYNPRETKLVQEARTHGLQAMTGLGMLVEQAALAFEIWTGYKPSSKNLFEAIQ